MRAIVGLLAVVDVAFIGLQVAADVTDYGFNGAYKLSLEYEHGIAQAFGWLQLGAAAVLLGLAWKRFAGSAAGFWAASLAYATFDDSLRIHENVGHYLDSLFGFGEVGGSRGHDVGEAIVYLVAIAVALGGFIRVETRARPQTPTMLSLLLLPIAVVFVFCAVVVDILGTSIPIEVEDGGELLAASAVLVATIVWTLRTETLAAEVSSDRVSPH